MYMHLNLPIIISQKRHNYDFMLSLFNMQKLNRIDLKGDIGIKILCTFIVFYEPH